MAKAVIYLRNHIPICERTTIEFEDLKSKPYLSHLCILGW